MRLIDADAFIQMMEKKCDPESTLDPWILSVCRGGVKMMPTVDAVPVVRCKDCLHNRACEIQYHAQAGDLFFCGAAERKDGKGNGNEAD